VSLGLEGVEEEVTSEILPAAAVESPSSGMRLKRGFFAMGLLDATVVGEPREGGAPLISDTRLARLHNASESMPAKALRLSREVLVASSRGRSAWLGSDHRQASWVRNLRTSSRTSSSQRLSLRPSEARMRISSASTGRVKVWGCTGRVEVEDGVEVEGGASWRGWLY
jgi:hypothetical protein